MNEEITTYQQAVALKECGFDWECTHYYTNGYVNDDPEDLTRMVKLHYANPYNHNKVIRESECYSAPTLTLAQKWMREVQGVDVYVIPHYHSGYEVAAKRLGDTPRDTIYVFDLWDSKKPYRTYESALSAGIDAALELINQK